MKNILSLIVITTISITTILFTTACQKVIQVDLNSSDPATVVEAIINDTNTPSKVKLSKSVNFSESNTFPAIKGAEVIISDNLGNKETLKDAGDGTYSGTTLKGISGRTYTLSIKTTDGKTFSSTSTMPNAVKFDSLYTIDRGGFGKNANAKVMVPFFIDPVSEVNYYHFAQRINGIKSNTDFVRDDQYSNGKSGVQPLFSGADKDKIVVGDKVDVEMNCIDQGAYLYFFSLDQLSGNRNSATPANPITNIKSDNKVLGYFSAQTSRIRSVTIK